MLFWFGGNTPLARLFVRKLRVMPLIDNECDYDLLGKCIFEIYKEFHAPLPSELADLASD